MTWGIKFAYLTFNCHLSFLFILSGLNDSFIETSCAYIKLNQYLLKDKCKCLVGNTWCPTGHHLWHKIFATSGCVQICKVKCAEGCTKCRLFADIFKWKRCIWLILNKMAFIQLIAWYRKGDKPSLEPTMVQFTRTHIYVSQCSGLIIWHISPLNPLSLHSGVPKPLLLTWNNFNPSIIN